MGIKKLLIKNTTINLAGYAYLTLASLISIPITLRYLGTSTFALLALITTVVNFSSLLHLGLNPAVIRYLALNSSNQQKTIRYFQAALLLTLLISLFVLLAGSLYLKLAHSQASFALLQWLTLTLILLNLLTNFFNTLPQAKNNFLFYNLKTFLVGSANTLLTAYLAFKTGSLAFILTARLASQLLTLFFQLLYTHHHLNFASLIHLKNIPQLLTTSYQLLSYASKKFLGLLSSQGVFHLPRLALATFLPLAQLPLFTIPQGLLANLQAALSQLTLALFPLSTTLLAQNKHRRLQKLILTTETFILFGFSLLTLLVFLFGQPLLALWLKNPTLTSQIYPLLKILTLAYSLSALSAIPATILDALGKPEIPAQFAALNLLLQIIFLTLFIPRYHLLGIPLAILTHNIIQVPLFLHRFSREIKNLNSCNTN